MAIPKKGSRKIVVNGENYRWRFRNVYNGEMYTGWGVSFAVEKFDNGKTDLHVRLYQAKNLNNPLNHTFDVDRSLTITPKLVAQAIDIALQQDWQPEQNGKTFELNLNSEEHNF